MIHAVVAWLVAAWLAHWQAAAAVFAYSVIEWVLPRTGWVKANSAWEGIFNVLAKTLLAKVPAVGAFVRFVASPELAALEQPDQK